MLGLKSILASLTPELSRQETGRPVFRPVAIGLLAALVAWGSIRIGELWYFGSSPTDTLARVERRVQGEINDLAASLEGITRRLSAEDRTIAGAQRDQPAVRRLFEMADAAVEPYGPHAAVTVYDPDGAPLAWAGRPSELPLGRIRGSEAFFVIPGAAGIRLVRLQPTELGGQRAGSIAAERGLAASPALPGQTSRGYVFQAGFVPVALRTRFEGAGAHVATNSFLIRAPNGDVMLQATVDPDVLAQSRGKWRDLARTVGLLLGACAILLALPGFVHPFPERHPRIARLFGILVVIIAVRIMLSVALSPHPDGSGWLLPTAFAFVGFGDLAASPVDFLFNGCMLLAIVGVTLWFIEARQVGHLIEGRSRLHPVKGDGPALVRHAVAAVIGGAVLVIYSAFLAETVASTRLDLMHFSLHSRNLARVALQFGVIADSGAVFGIVWALYRHMIGRVVRPTLVRIVPALLVWMLAGGAVAFGARRFIDTPVWPLILMLTTVGLLSFGASRLLSRWRRGSGAFRLLAGFLVLLTPALLTYPTLRAHARKAERHLVESVFAPQVADQRDALQLAMTRSLEQIDRVEALAELVATADRPEGGLIPTDSAFLIWTRTDLAALRLTSAIELYAGDGTLVSRFALNLPEYASTAQPWTEPGCRWDKFTEVSPFGSEERRVLHAGRGICAEGVQRGAIVVHAMLDIKALPFLTSQSPYFELFRGASLPEREGVAGQDIEFVAYGWGRTPIFTSSNTAWPLDDELFRRIYASRRSFWTTLIRDGREFSIFIMNDRSGIYALGYPIGTPFEILLQLAELTSLVGLAYLLLLMAGAAFGAVAGWRPVSARAIWRDVRASFYRKLFLAFVAASILPVLTLALVIRAYVAGELRAGVEAEAAKTTAVARRVLEDYAVVDQPGVGSNPRFDDDILVWLSRIIDQDVNIFEGARLTATSERDLFASGLLPTRTPDDVYRAIVLRRSPNFVGYGQIGGQPYMLAASPLRIRGREAVLTVPLALRQREIERNIDSLDRGVHLATLMFILLAAGLGYSMAERIADPINRLTRATQQIARGDFSARIVATSADELKRLVDAFNRMAAELERQRERLQRTNRLEAWAEMARQVAHEIKNPLTPIQLSAEHLGRIHTDRGRPLSPVLEACIESILTQVSLLRQISAEFSSFASSPQARPEWIQPRELIDEVVKPYLTGLSDDMQIVSEIEDNLPRLWIDRTLTSRAITNIIENALYAMPAGGTLTLTAMVVPAHVRIEIKDTGAGMDVEAQRRLFEPYFSTKATGTGLGLSIAKRNIELNHGKIEVTSERGSGTTVTLMFPIDSPAQLGSPEPAGSAEVTPLTPTR